jgi:hypothetical protein
MALIADFPACILLFQKLMSRKEANPIPSHPRNMTRILSAVTRSNINPVNNER